jgi:hypothetical protein
LYPASNCRRPPRLLLIDFASSFGVIIPYRGVHLN